MTTEKQMLAEAAMRVLNEPVFADALTEIRMEALLALGDVDPEDATEIHRQQAIVKVTEALRDSLEAKIYATGQMDGGMSAEPEDDE